MSNVCSRWPLLWSCVVCGLAVLSNPMVCGLRITKLREATRADVDVNNTQATIRNTNSQSSEYGLLLFVSQWCWRQKPVGNTLHCHLKVHAWLFILHWYPLSLAVLCKCSFGYRTGKRTGVQVNFKSSLPVSLVNIITLDTFVNKINGVSDNCGSYDILGLWGTMLKSLILCDIKYPEASARSVLGANILKPSTNRSTGGAKFPRYLWLINAVQLTDANFLVRWVFCITSIVSQSTIFENGE